MPRFRTPHSTSRLQPAILVAAGPSASPRRATLDELGSLLVGLEFTVEEVVRQRRPPDSSTWIGSGKLEELTAAVQRVRAWTGVDPLVVLAAEVEPGRLRALEAGLGVSVIDRTELILRVFEARADSPLAELEIERARLVHALPRLRDQVGPTDREGGGGRGGRGHSNVVLAKRATMKRIAELDGRIDALRRAVDERVDRRADVPRVALVGYTNAGKSSWMEALTGHSGGVRDALFHTLGTRVRALAHNPGPRILVADTVGFLEGLPHSLLDAFHSTLREALAADLWVHVADASSPYVDEQIETTRRVLGEVSSHAAPSLLLLNKIDRVDDARREELAARYPEAQLVSSRDRQGVHEVSSFLRAFVEDELGERGKKRRPRSAENPALLSTHD